jgi:excisionase family DNA binding protein
VKSVPGLGGLLHGVQEKRLKKLENAAKEAAKKAPVADERRLLTSKEVAPLVGVQHHKTVERWAREGKLRCIRNGRSLRFQLSDVRRWVAQRKEG